MLDTKSGPTIKMVETTETISEEDLVLNIMRSVSNHVTDGMAIYELCETLKTCFEISPGHVCDLMQKIKIELDMYCPDRKHLYFVNA